MSVQGKVHVLFEFGCEAMRISYFVIDLWPHKKRLLKCGLSFSDITYFTFTMPRPKINFTKYISREVTILRFLSIL